MKFEIFFITLSIVGWANANDTLCHEGQRTEFTCTTSHGKIVSICSVSTEAANGGLIYLFGKKNKIEMNFVGAAPNHTIYYEVLPTYGGSDERMWFDSGDYRYVIYSQNGRSSGEYYDRAGVYINKGGRLISNVKCNDESHFRSEDFLNTLEVRKSGVQ